MTLDLFSIPLAFLAGIVGILSPCCWPLIPIIIASVKGDKSIKNTLALCVGLTLMIASSGTIIMYALVSGYVAVPLDVLKIGASFILLLFGISLVVPELKTFLFKPFSKLNINLRITKTDNILYYFLIGALLGFVWLPCLGPTVGAAMALALLGQSLILAFIVMLAYGIGLSTVFILISYGVANILVDKVKERINIQKSFGYFLIGFALFSLGIMYV